MARINSLTNFLTDIAEAIKAKTGKTDPITPANFDTEIASIQTGSVGDETMHASYAAALDSSEGELCTQLPDGITSIGDYAFYKKENLALTSIPDSVISIGYDGFYYCTNLKLNKLSNKLETVGAYAFQGCVELALTELPDSIKIIDNYAFANCRKLAINKLPANLEEIKDYAFQGCSGISISGEFPNTLTKIGGYAFSNAGVGDVIIPDNVTSMGQRAFSNSTITSIKIGTGITYIDMQCFASTSKLTKVTIYGDISSISGGAFNGSSALRTLLLPNVTKVPNLANDYTIYSCPLRGGSGSVYVPDNLVDAFKAAEYWKNLASNIKPISEYGGEI